MEVDVSVELELDVTDERVRMIHAPSYETHQLEAKHKRDAGVHQNDRD